MEPVQVVLAFGAAPARGQAARRLRAGDVAVVAEARTGDEAVELCRYFRPDLLVLDLALARPRAGAAVRAATAAYPDVRIVVVGGAGSDAAAVEALEAGAVGMLGFEDLDSLPRIVAAAAAGEAIIPRRLGMQLLERVRATTAVGAGLRPVRSRLTDREWEVLDLLASGASTDEIARALVLSTETVRSHLKNLYRKLEVRSREDAVAAAARMRERPGVPA